MITLAFDFGLAYPAVMKGVTLSRIDGRSADVAHDLSRQDVRTAAFRLRETFPYSSPTVHLVAVDLGVGTDRHAVVLRADDRVFVDPDSGVLRPPVRRVAAELDDDVSVEAYEIDVPDPESMTFRGRDVFTPTATDAHVAGALAPGSADRFEPVPVDSLSECRLFETTVSDDGRKAMGGVLVVGDFGNCIANVPGAFVRDAVGETVWMNGESIPTGRTFEAVMRGEKLVMVSSHGNVEYDVNHSRGNKAFGLTSDDRAELRVD